MSISTHGFYPNVKREQIIKIIKMISVSSAEKPFSTSYEEYVTFDFTYKKEGRSINLHNIKIDQEADIKKWKSENVSSIDYVKRGLPDKTKGILTSIGYWGHSVEIFTLLANFFGGFVDESDSDVQDFYYVEKDFHKLIRTLFKLSWRKPC